MAGGEFGELYIGEDGGGEELGGLCGGVGLGSVYEYDGGPVEGRILAAYWTMW